jgi:hypothetical protein
MRNVPDLLNHFPGYRLDAVSDCFLVDVESEAVNTFHGSLLVGLTRGDLFDPAAHYELSATWRLPLSTTYAFKHITYVSPKAKSTKRLKQLGITVV